MSTIFLQNQIEGCPQYVDFDPYVTSDSKYRVSVSDDYLYDKTEVELGKDNASTNYSLSNDLFEDFLLNHVFRVYKSGGDNAAAATTTDYTADTDSSKDPVERIEPAKITLSSEDGAQPVKTHLAGTLFTYNVINSSTKVNFNCALLMEETFKDNGTSISKVDIELRMTEPLMQTLISTTGNVYDFKKTVKISDFMDNLEQVDEVPTDPNIKYNKGFFQFRMMEPTNMSVAKDSVSTTPISTPTSPTLGTGESLYTINTDVGSPKAPPAIDATSFTGDKFTAVTNFTGYFIMCTFGESVKGITTSNGLLSKKPYLTIIRIVNSRVVNTQFSSIFGNENLTGYTQNNCILDYITTITNTIESKQYRNVVINVDDVGPVVPFDLALTVSGALKDLEANLTITPKFYVMNAMKTS